MAKKYLNSVFAGLSCILFCVAWCVFLSSFCGAQAEESNPATEELELEDTGVPPPPLEEIKEDSEQPTETSKETLAPPSWIEESPVSEEEAVEGTVGDEEQKNSETSKPKTISLDLRGIEITEFLKVISNNIKKNIIPTKRVNGKINLSLNNITYEDAFEVVVISQGLAYEKRDDNVILVMTDAEYETLYGKKFNEKIEMKTLKLENARPKIVLNALSKIQSKVGSVIVDEVTGTVILIDTPEKMKTLLDVLSNLEKPLVTETFELQYAKPADIQENIASIITPDTGKVLTDERTSTLIVTDLSGNMEKIRQAVRALDQETKQVFIEAEILSITLRDRLQTGINWSKALGDLGVAASVLSGTFPSSTTLSNKLQLTAGTLTEDKMTMTVQYLNTLGDTKVLSQPRIAVTNNQEATILVGERQAYVTGTTSQSGESTITSDTVEFIDVGVKLKVVPTINRDGFITMKIKPEVSEVVDTLTTGSEDEPRSIIPIVSTSEAETTIKVKDGTTLFIAGLRKNEAIDRREGIPFLQRIPLLGALLSNRDNDNHVTEIIIFITPYIITGETMMMWDKEKIKQYPTLWLPKHKREIKDLKTAITPELKESKLKRPN